MADEGHCCQIGCKLAKQMSLRQQTLQKEEKKREGADGGNGQKSDDCTEFVSH